MQSLRHIIIVCNSHGCSRLSEALMPEVLVCVASRLKTLDKKRLQHPIKTTLQSEGAKALI